MRRFITFTLCCLWLISTHAFAGQLIGTVTDQDGNPVAGAEVQVWGKDITTTTGSDGSFSITSDELLDGNRYSVTVTADGFDQGQTLSIEVYDDPEFTIPLEVVMYEIEEMPELDYDPMAYTNLMEYYGQIYTSEYEEIDFGDHFEEDIILFDEDDTDEEGGSPDTP